MLKRELHIPSSQKLLMTMIQIWTCKEPSFYKWYYVKKDEWLLRQFYCFSGGRLYSSAWAVLSSSTCYYNGIRWSAGQCPQASTSDWLHPGYRYIPVTSGKSLRFECCQWCQLAIRVQCLTIFTHNLFAKNVRMWKFCAIWVEKCVGLRQRVYQL